MTTAREFTTDTGQHLFNVHTASECRGACPIHKPSMHHMRDWPLHYREDRGMFERLCPHGVGHPDPDSLHRMVEYHEDLEASIHGCCHKGCCYAKP